MTVDTSLMPVAQDATQPTGTSAPVAGRNTQAPADFAQLLLLGLAQSGQDAAPVIPIQQDVAGSVQQAAETVENGVPTPLVNRRDKKSEQTDGAEVLVAMLAVDPNAQEARPPVEPIAQPGNVDVADQAVEEIVADAPDGIVKEAATSSQATQFAAWAPASEEPTGETISVISGDSAAYTEGRVDDVVPKAETADTESVEQDAPRAGTTDSQPQTSSVAVESPDSDTPEAVASDRTRVARSEGHAAIADAPAHRGNGAEPTAVNAAAPRQEAVGSVVSTDTSARFSWSQTKEGAVSGSVVRARLQEAAPVRETEFSLQNAAAAPQAAESRAASTQALESTEVTEGDLPRRVIDQVVREVRLQRMPERSDVVVKLTPPELGSIRLHVVQDGQGLATQIHAGSDQVRGLLQAHLPMLVDALADAGIRMDSVSVTSGSQFAGSGNEWSQSNAQQQSGDARRRHTASRGSMAEAVPAFAVSAATGGVQSTGGYNWLA